MTTRTHYLVGLLAGLLAAVAAGAGTISGTVKALPPAGMPETAGGGGAYDSRRYKFAERIDYEHLRDFIVYIDQPVAGAPAVTPQLAAVTTQRDASFDPHVLPVAVGTTVRWPNEDEIYHNVYSESPVKRFDLDFYKKERVPDVKFDQVGRVDVYCAIHAKMHCIVLVLPNIYFARADAKGRFVIKDVPPGTYQLRAWHERLPSQVREVVVPADGAVRVDFALGVGELPKY
jgi:plastocyanin